MTNTEPVNGTAAEAASQPAEGSEKVAPPLYGVPMSEYLKEGDTDEYRETFTKAIDKVRSEAAKDMARMQRDMRAAEAGNKWHKAINAQLDICEDAIDCLKEAEKSLRGVYALVPNAKGTALLREDEPVSAEDLTVTELVEFKAVKSALEALNEATAGLAKRSADLGVVKMALSAKVGYKALDMMATAGAVKPDVKKALDEAKTLVEREEKERKSKMKEDKGNTGSQGQHKRPYGQEGGWGRNTSQGGWKGWGDRHEPTYRNDSAQGGWGSGGSGSTMGAPRAGSQGMASGKGGGKGWGDGSCNKCGAMGHWARDCPRGGWGQGD